MTRNKHSKEFKLQVVNEAIETGNKALVACPYEIAANMLHRWVREFENGKYGVTTIDAINEIEAKQMAQENDQLKHLLGEQALEIAILRDLIKKEKPSFADKVEVADHYIDLGYTITLVLRLVKIPRSSYYYHKYNKVAVKTVSEGRQIPGFSLQRDGAKVPDSKFKNG
ncbi:transposase [Paenibacillus sp. 2TAB23]|uniref:transposase n=1 Tax=Paenibacillus sp. 2TAB23 TaxID=3233004 RepID=UPI003F9DB9F2